MESSNIGPSEPNATKVSNGGTAHTPILTTISSLNLPDVKDDLNLNEASQRKASATPDPEPASATPDLEPASPTPDPESASPTPDTEPASPTPDPDSKRLRELVWHQLASEEAVNTNAPVRLTALPSQDDKVKTMSSPSATAYPELEHLRKLLCYHLASEAINTKAPVSSAPPPNHDGKAKAMSPLSATAHLEPDHLRELPYHQLDQLDQTPHLQPPQE